MNQNLVVEHNPQLWARVEAYQNERLCKRFAEKHGMPLDLAKTVFLEMKRFLYISILSNQPCSPSKIVDEMWHEFIMHTIDYRGFCSSFDVGFIDHTPSDVPELVGYIRTKGHAQSIFGALDSFCWPDPTRATVGDCTCSNQGCTCNCSETDAKTDEQVISSVPS